MRTELYTFYDTIALQHGSIFHARNQADAIRAFLKTLNEKEDRDDFELVYLGSYDHDTAELEVVDIPEKVPVSFPKEGVLRDAESVS